MTLTLPKSLQPLFEHLINEKLTPIIVGGYVRDSILKHPRKILILRYLVF
jgi:tRNA nucleotidyltransferase/poly(A) polymerase